MKKKKIRFYYNRALVVKQALITFNPNSVIYGADSALVFKSMALDMWQFFEEKTVVQQDFSKEFREYQVRFLLIVIQNHFHNAYNDLSPFQRSICSTLITELHKLITG